MPSLLTEDEIKVLVADWYGKLDRHAPMVDILPMLSTSAMEMRFPEATLKSLADFENWYQNVIRVFFDEVHTIKEVTPYIRGDKAEVKVMVRWEASRWRPPAATSDRIILNAYQTWLIVKSPETGRPLIQNYFVDELVYTPDSARL